MAIASIGFSIVRVLEAFLVSERVKEQAAQTDAFAVQAAPYLANFDAQGMYELCYQNGGNIGGRVIILDDAGVVQADGLSLLNGQRLTHNEISGILAGHTPRSHAFHRLTSYNSGIWAVYYTSAIVQNGRTLGVLLASVSMQDITDTIREITNRLALISFIAAVAVCIMCIIASGYITKPLGAFAQAVHSLSLGRFDKRVEVKGKSELAQLSHAFNMMSEKLEDLDHTRNEFVSNASHELKTPLSTMKILIETLLYQQPLDPVMAKEFLTDINAEIDRLNNVIVDLLAIVQTEELHNPLHREPVLLGELLSRITSKLRPLAESKNLEFRLNLEEEIATVCDSLKMELALSNIIDNAIKYTNEGSVVVHMYRNAQQAYIVVKDTGIGIPQKEVSRIFDRFYRVDKARSRNTGGTGLGLSIAQRIISLHNGLITVDSAEGSGTVFTVRLPVVSS